MRRCIYHVNPALQRWEEENYARLMERKRREGAARGGALRALLPSGGGSGARARWVPGSGWQGAALADPAGEAGAVPEQRERTQQSGAGAAAAAAQPQPADAKPEPAAPSPPPRAGAGRPAAAPAAAAAAVQSRQSLVGRPAWDEAWWRDVREQPVATNAAAPLSRRGSNPPAGGGSSSRSGGARAAGATAVAATAPPGPARRPKQAGAPRPVGSKPVAGRRQAAAVAWWAAGEGPVPAGCAAGAAPAAAPAVGPSARERALEMARAWRQQLPAARRARPIAAVGAAEPCASGPPPSQVATADASASAAALAGASPAPSPAAPSPAVAAAKPQPPPAAERTLPELSDSMGAAAIDLQPSELLFDWGSGAGSSRGSGRSRGGGGGGGGEPAESPEECAG
ncbi:hypothetical protein Rsub_05544 [Raphidocelis subcapitata]|uniref:Uncharacterized protein n=1 Tax=Raphidocelis subcapitata TaxID=307507 RepID=A0A2V0P096_9CHLO|nr:hypothetical protein Rsub_05544 [Raphidocelis subcapitata]|eukprot:GBF92342.1 hypothetical protein Rsub_05544 [Raphidocelis subcapitata]